MQNLRDDVPISEAAQHVIENNYKNPHTQHITNPNYNIHKSVGGSLWLSLIKGIMWIKKSNKREI